jgi:uncharacterized membrane protein
VELKRRSADLEFHHAEFRNLAMRVSKKPTAYITNSHCEFSISSAWVAILASLLLAVKSSCFALFSLIVCVLNDILDANCSSSSILASCHYAAIWGWLTSAAQ